ncbi:6-phosphogluconolactonase [Fluoribacter dumoffii]|nr:6-phosphogluconolactonase [Fluoribacter dumoffii]MCW8386619.1 6-phosphogluconolactonase [Fluoribacter dumoffii]MCW8419673.1 6-phosphogluconolactonase [Fluoribacter dumoffii]MCW8455624.1 6-phosphogluconolactonase [Fluoribacter dumoffii]MCW8460297.1 6-phosphogluconolactonase [Fluoribacter dumoffii]MCW8483776.1 6-phosphogluconolactonase [Fluoribacter dumoffii]
MQLHSFSEASLLTEDLIEQLKNVLCDAINKRGHAYLVLSGGKTPINLFKGLANTDLPWDKVTITLADERCVAIDDSERNEHLVRQFLLQNHASRAHFVSLLNEECSIEQTERIIASLPTFDAVVLGMGEDGHTASLFPCSDELLQGLDDNAGAVLRVSPKKAPYQRISLSKKRLLNSRVIFFHLVGPKKLSVLHQAMAEHDPTIMPVSAFLNNRDANVQVLYAP